jgi:hypothetical protein
MIFGGRVPLVVIEESCGSCKQTIKLLVLDAFQGEKGRTHFQRVFQSILALVPP